MALIINKKNNIPNGTPNNKHITVFTNSLTYQLRCEVSHEFSLTITQETHMTNTQKQTAPVIEPIASLLTHQLLSLG